MLTFLELAHMVDAMGLGWGGAMIPDICSM